MKATTPSITYPRTKRRHLLWQGQIHQTRALTKKKSTHGAPRAKRRWALSAAMCRRKYSTLWISVICKELPEQSGTDMVRFRYTVSDTGVGMSREQLESIFEPFYRIGTTTTTGVEGSGLGLAIVKSTLELMGGSIEVKSAPNEGSSFIIEVPFRVALKQREPQEALPPQPRPVGDFSGITVLLVEDHPINAIVATRMLEKGGADVVMATNGMEGFERFKRSGRDEFDAVLMDIQMPVMNGYEATWAIRECDHPRAKTIPIIAMTADAFAEDVKKARDSGMNEHISKPVEMSRLYEVLGNLSKYEKRI